MTPKDEPAGAPSAGLKCCPTCDCEFHPKRKDQRYCAKTCAKKATRNASRGPRNAEQRRMDMVHYKRALDLAGMLYTAPVHERLGMMQHILSAATGHDRALRRILTDPRLLKASPQDAHMFHRRAPASYRTISQAANAYTQRFFGVSIKTYLEQARKGCLNWDHKVHRKADLGAVPSLSKIRRPKCWHRPLAA